MNKFNAISSGLLLSAMPLPLNGHWMIIIQIKIFIEANMAGADSLEYFIEGLGRRSTVVIGIMRLVDSNKSVCINPRLEIMKTSLHCIPSWCNPTRWSFSLQARARLLLLLISVNIFHCHWPQVLWVATLALLIHQSWCLLSDLGNLNQKQIHVTAPQNTT